MTALAQEGVDFVLVGGLAANLHGSTRVTRDIDIAYATHHENVQRLCAVINRFEPRAMVLGEPEGDVLTLTPDRLKRERILKLHTTIGELDMLNSIEGFKSYGQIKKLSEASEIANGLMVPVLSVSGLLKTKRALRRPKDLQDIIELEAIQEVQSTAKAEAEGQSFQIR